MNKLLGLFLLALAFLAPGSVGQATLVTLPSPIFFPGIYGNNVNAPTISSGATLTSAGHYLAYVFVAREDMVISHVGFRAGTSSGSPTVTVSIETVDGTTGLPSGSAGFGSTNGTTGTVSSNTDVLQSLGGSATIPKGSVFAVKVALATGTSQILSNLQNATEPFQSATPYQVLNTGTPTKSQTSSTGLFVLGSNSTTFYNVTGTLGVNATGASAFNNSTAGAQRGLRFTPPMNGRVIGVRLFANGASGDFNLCMYNDAGTELNNSCTAFGGGQSSGNAFGSFVAYFDNTVTITAGTSYRVAIQPTTTTNVSVSTITIPTNYISATPAGSFSTATYATFTTAGGWVDSTTQIPFMDVVMDQVDNGAGTGGGGRCIGC